MAVTIRSVELLVAASYVFFFNDTATTEIYTLSLHDALPISKTRLSGTAMPAAVSVSLMAETASGSRRAPKRSEEHTSELQSRQYLVCRLLLEKKITLRPISLFIISVIFCIFRSSLLRCFFYF